MSLELNADEIVENALQKASELILEKPLYAEVILQQVLKCVPDHPPALHFLGIVKQRTGEYAEGVKILTKAIELDPLNPDNYNNISLCYANLEEFDKSIEFLEKGLVLKPDHYLYINNLAMQYRQIRRHDLAIELLNKALALNNKPEIWINLGGIYGELKDMKNSAKCFKKALELDPEYPAAHIDLAFTLHLNGQWEEGFEHYEWRFKHYKQLEFYKNRYDQNKLWNGTDSLMNKRILLYGEQGLGDMIHFTRYVKQLKMRGAYTILHVAESVSSILGRCVGVDEVVLRDITQPVVEPFPPYDYQCSLMSLPWLLKDFKLDGRPYLTPFAKFNVREQSDYKDTFNVGVCWAGSAAHPNDRTRSMQLGQFRNIHNMPGVKLFSLQCSSSQRIYVKGKSVTNFSEGCEDMRLVNCPSMIMSFEDTATIIAGLDLVISVDTALVHLAGALGVKCWTLLPFDPDWRWCLTGDKTEWYDSLKLYRQPSWNDWESVMKQVEVDLAVLVEDARRKGIVK